MTPDNDARNVTTDQFDTLVISASRQRPVLVDFWAPWCQPCQVLAPVLEQLAAKLAGKLDLVKVNTEEEQQLAQRFAIRGIPNLKLFVDGSVVTEITGVQPLPVIEAQLAPFLPRPSDKLRADAELAVIEGEPGRALELLNDALRSDPENFRIHPQLADVLIASGQLDAAEQTLKMLPAHLQQGDQVKALRARLTLARIAEAASLADLERTVASDPADLHARYQLGALLALMDDHEKAMAHFLHIVREDRGFEDDGGRQRLLDVFTLLHNEGPLVRKYRGLLASAIR